MCGCAQRRILLASATRAALAGDTAAAGSALAGVAASLQDDGRALAEALRQGRAAAALAVRSRLSGMGRAA